MLLEQLPGVIGRAASFFGPSQSDLEDVVHAVFSEISAVVDREIENLRLDLIDLYGFLYL